MLPREFLHAVDFQHRRRHEGTPRTFLGERRHVPARTPLVHLANVSAQARRGGFGDDGTDIRFEPCRVADAEFVHGTGDHVDGLAGNVLLKVQDPQRRAALSGAAERRFDHIVGNLFQQRAGIHEHRILPTCLGDQRRDGRIPRRQRTIDQPCGLGASGECHTGGLRMPDQRIADGPVTGDQMQCIDRDSGGVHEANRFIGDQRCFLRRFGDHGIAGHQRGGDLPRKDGERKVPTD